MESNTKQSESVRSAPADSSTNNSQKTSQKVDDSRSHEEVKVTILSSSPNTRVRHIESVTSPGKKLRRSSIIKSDKKVYTVSFFNLIFC